MFLRWGPWETTGHFLADFMIEYYLVFKQYGFATIVRLFWRFVDTIIFGIFDRTISEDSSSFFFVGGIPDLVVFHNSYSGNIIYERHRNEILAILLYCFVGYYFDVWLKVRLLFILEVVTICCSLKNQCCTK